MVKNIITNSQMKGREIFIAFFFHFHTTILSSPIKSISTLSFQQQFHLQQAPQEPYHMLFTLTGHGFNKTFDGVIYIRNWSVFNSVPPALEQPHYLPYSYHPEDRRKMMKLERAADVTGATYYVIAVVLVYGMSIVLLIASHIKRKHSKVRKVRRDFKKNFLLS